MARLRGATKERLYIEAGVLIDPVARQVLDELNTELLLDTGTVSVTGVQDDGNGGHVAVWDSRGRKEGGRREPDRDPRLFWDRVPSPASPGRHPRRLAAERLQRGAGQRRSCQRSVPSPRPTSATWSFQTGGDYRYHPRRAKWKGAGLTGTRRGALRTLREPGCPPSSGHPDPFGCWRYAPRVSSYVGGGRARPRRSCSRPGASASDRWSRRTGARRHRSRPGTAKSRSSSTRSFSISVRDSWRLA